MSRRSRAWRASAVFIGCLTLAPASAGAAGWSAQTVPVLRSPFNSRPTGVSCQPSGGCVAVGYYAVITGSNHPFAESRSGTTWTLQSVPVPSAATTAVLGGVSCPSATDCVAVGTWTDGASHTSTLVEVYNGTGWAVQSSPTPAGASSLALQGVSCFSATACVAVGYYAGASGTSAFSIAWNGSGWTFATAPNPAGETGALFAGVSCPAATTCEAVGYASNSSGDEALAERWNGTAWTPQNTEMPANAANPYLSGVSCTSATSCMAVGWYKDTKLGKQLTLAEGLSGTAWFVSTTPDPIGATTNGLAGISCAAGSACTAVGYSGTKSNVSSTLAERWNGTGWFISTTQNPSSRYSELTGVSCPAATSCTALGDYIKGGASLPVLAEGFDGTSWTIQAALTPTGASSTTLGGVACVTASSCETVGSVTLNDGQTLTFASAWDGAKWTVQKTANPTGTASSGLARISCTAVNACTAVGSYLQTKTSTTLPLAERWDGTAWTLQAVPAPTGASATRLVGVSCSSASVCNASGTTDSGQIVERWHAGGSWMIEATPDFARLDAISCRSDLACTTVGSSSGAAPYAEAFNGTTWSTQSVPAPPGTTQSEFYGVSCPVLGVCFAVGYYYGSTGLAQNLGEKFSGGAWSPQTVPSHFGAAGNVLQGISCVSISACTAVGEWQGGVAGSASTVAEAWNGTSWTVQPTPNPPDGQGGFAAVSCTSASACTAVGESHSLSALGFYVPLVERHS